MKIVVDSSVIVAAVKLNDQFHDRSLQFFKRVQDRNDEVWTPITVLWEIGSALDHPRKTPTGSKFNPAAQLHLNFIPVDEGLFQRTWRPGLRIPVKAGDRIFLSCALEKDAILVSWDNSLVRHANASGVRAVTPDAYLSDGI